MEDFKGSPGQMGAHGLDVATPWAKGLIVTGIVIAVLNMALAWTMMFWTPLPETNGDTPTRIAARLPFHSAAQSDAASQRQSTAVERPADRVDTFNVKMIETLQRAAESQERQTTLLLGFCFALISIGFSLIVMGVEGASGFKAGASEWGSLAVKVSSPGLLCIFLASALLFFGLGEFPGGSAGQSAQGEADIARAKFEGKENVIRAREDLTRAEAEVKERIIEAETQAKKELLEAEVDTKERLLEAERAGRSNE